MFSSLLTPIIYLYHKQKAYDELFGLRSRLFAALLAVLLGILLCCGFLLRTQEHNHLASFQLGVLLHTTKFSTLVSKPVQQIQTDGGMRNFTSAETDRNLYLVSSLEKTLGVVGLGIKVIAVNTRAETNFLDLHDMLLFSCFLFSLRLFKAELAVVHDAANRRLSLRSNFYKIKILGSGCFQRLGDGYNADLISVSVNQSDFLVADLLINLVF